MPRVILKFLSYVYKWTFTYEPGHLSAWKTVYFRWWDRLNHQQRVTSLKLTLLCVDMELVSSNGCLIWDQNEQRWTKFLNILQFYTWVYHFRIFSDRDPFWLWFLLTLNLRHFVMQIQMKFCSYWHSFSPFLMAQMTKDQHITYIRNFSLFIYLCTPSCELRWSQNLFFLHTSMKN